MPDPLPIPADVSKILARLNAPRPMRRGSVSERRIKCNKPGCRCHDDDRYRHGPYISLTRSVGGRTRSRYLTAEQAERVRGQIEIGRTFRADVEALWRACETWADAEIARIETAPKSAAEKKGSKRRSKRRSAGKSKR